MDIRQLRYFLTVSQEHSFSAAAKKLFVTQPTLSTAIKKLEDDLNHPLFFKEKNTLTLTPAGKMLNERGGKLLLEFDKLTEDVQHYGENQKTYIRLGMTTVFARKFMPLISQFLITHQNCDITLRQGGSPELQRALANNEIDLGIISFPKFEKNIDLEPINNLSYHICVVVPYKHPLSQETVIYTDQLKGQRFASFSKKYTLGKHLEYLAKAANFTPNIVYSGDNISVLLNSLEDMNAISLMAIEYKSFVKCSSNLHWIPLIDPNSQIQIGLAHTKHFFMTDSIRELINILHSNKL